MVESSRRIGFEHRVSYETLFGGRPDALYVLGGGIEKDGGALGFRSPHFFSNNGDGVGGGRYRMLAVRDVARTISGIPIFTSGGSAYPGITPPTADVVAHELMLRGIDKGRITRFPEVMTTSMEMVRIIQVAENFGTKTSSDQQDESRIVVVTNEYHKARAERIFGLLAQGNTWLLPFRFFEDFGSFAESSQQTLIDFARSNVQVIFQSCESILTVKDPSFVDFFAAVKATPEYAARERLEEQGLLDLNKKEYTSRV